MFAPTSCRSHRTSAYNTSEPISLENHNEYPHGILGSIIAITSKIIVEAVNTITAFANIFAPHQNWKIYPVMIRTKIDVVAVITNTLDPPPASFLEKAT